MGARLTFHFRRSACEGRKRARSVFDMVFGFEEVGVDDKYSFDDAQLFSAFV